MNPNLDDLRLHYTASEPLPGAEQRILTGVSRASTTRPRRRWRRLAAGAGAVAVVAGIGTATASVWMPDSVRESFSWSAPGSYDPDLSTVRALVTAEGAGGSPLTLWEAKAKWTPDSLIFGRGLCFTVATGTSQPLTGTDRSEVLVSGCGDVSRSELRTTGYLASAGSGSPVNPARDVGVYRVPGATRARIEFADGTGGEYRAGGGWAVLPVTHSRGYPATVVALDAHGREISRATIKDPFPDLPR